MGNTASRPYLSDPALFATQVDPLFSEVQSKEAALREYEIYDYVVVGAGAAGCVLANRLSEDPNIKVLLVEAGGSNEGQLHSRIPIAFGKMFKTAGDWAYYTTPQPGMNGRELYWPRGKLLGGSTSINAMMYQHCSPSDFDEWEKLGAKGWGYKDLAPYFRSSEKFTPNALYPDVKTEERGASGPWQTGFSHLTPISGKFIEASKELGIGYNPDVNTPRGSLGVTKFATFIDPKGQRSSSATAYLTEEVIARTNLTIAINTMTTRVLFSSEARPCAIGIEVAQDADSPRFRVAARREVILCGGAINTPQLLNLSGIGARAELDVHQIPVVKDLPAVGKNLLDHLAVSVTFRAKPGTTLDYMVHPVKSLFALVQWLVYGTGPATSNVGETALFVRSVDAAIPMTSKASINEAVEDVTSGPDAPDLELIGVPMAFLNHGLELPPAGSNCFTIAPTHLRPLSTGRIALRSTSPFAAALIDANYLSHPNDIKVFARGVRLALRLARTAALRPVLSPRAHAADTNDVFWPGDADADAVRDEELEAFIRAKAETLYHPVGTARIGPDARASVVSPELRVHGVAGLRVVDASVFPAQISGHPTATVIAVAEKAAQMILSG